MRVLKTLMLSVLLGACAGSGTELAFSPVLRSVWNERCPEQQIRVRETRRDGAGETHVLEACGALFEVQQRVQVTAEPGLSQQELAKLAASLEQVPAPESIRRAAQGFSERPCDDDESYRECVGPEVEIMGSDSDDAGRRWWIRAGDRVGIARFIWTRPLCHEHRYGRRPTCDL